MEDFLRRALGMTKAARQLGRAALSEQMTRVRWRLGQPLDQFIRQLRAADSSLQQAEEILQELLDGEPRRPKRQGRRTH